MSLICTICKRVIMDETDGDVCLSPGCKAYAKKKEDEASKPVKKRKKKC